jgi:hypothetical protein
MNVPNTGEQNHPEIHRSQSRRKPPSITPSLATTTIRFVVCFPQDCRVYDTEGHMVVDGWLTRNFIVVVVFALAIGCSPKTHEPVQRSPNETGGSVQRLLDASPGRERHIASWDFVRSQAELVGEEHYDYSPISLRMSLANEATDWSVVVGERRVHSDADPDTLRLSIVNFASGLQWEPIQTASTEIIATSDTEGATRFLEWRVNDKSDPTYQRLELRFKVPERR